MVVRSTKIAAIFGVFPKALHWGYSVQNDMLEQLLAYTRWQHRPVTCGMILISVGVSSTVIFACLQIIGILCVRIILVNTHYDQAGMVAELG